MCDSVPPAFYSLCPLEPPRAMTLASNAAVDWLKDLAKALQLVCYI